MSDKNEVETFFTQSKSTFPIPTSDGKIELDGFLTASSHLAQFFGMPILSSNILSERACVILFLF